MVYNRMIWAQDGWMDGWKQPNAIYRYKLKQTGSKQTVRWVDGVYFDS